jgi:hypothetical protein
MGELQKAEIHKPLSNKSFASNLNESPFIHKASAPFPLPLTFGQ